MEVLKFPTQFLNEFVLVAGTTSCGSSLFHAEATLFEKNLGLALVLHLLIFSFWWCPLVVVSWFFSKNCRGSILNIDVMWQYLICFHHISSLFPLCLSSQVFSDAPHMWGAWYLSPALLPFVLFPVPQSSEPYMAQFPGCNVWDGVWQKLSRAAWDLTKWVSWRPFWAISELT